MKTLIRISKGSFTFKLVKCECKQGIISLGHKDSTGYGYLFIAALGIGFFFTIF